MSKTVTCRECGAAVELPDERTAGFCPECGTLISASAADARVSVITPAPAPIHPAPMPPATAVAETVLLSPGEPESPNNPAPTAPAPDESDNAPPDGALFYEPPINASQFIAPPVPAKKRTMKIIAAVAAVFVVAAAAVVFFAVPALAGDAYQRAEANFLASIIPATPVGSGGAKRTDFTIEYTPSAGLGLEELGSLLLRGSVNAFERGVDSEMTVSIAGEREIDVAISTDGRETIMSLPNLTDYYFKIISEDTASPQFDYGDIDEQELTDALSNILGEYFRLTKDVAEAEKNVTLYFGAEGIVCDKHSIDITEDMAARLLLMGIDEIRRSPSLSALIVNMMTAYGETPDLEAALAEAEESIRKTLSGSALLLRMTVWIKDKTIIARRFDQIQGTDAVFHYQAYSTDAWRSLMINLASGSMDFALDAEFKKNGSAWSGGMVLSAKDTYYEEEMLNAALTATDISIANERVTGQLEIIGELYGGDGGYFELRVALGDENGRQTILLTGLADDGYSELDLGSLFLSFATTDADAPTTPALDENFAVMVPGPFPASNYSDYNSDENTARIDAMASQLRIHAADREARGEVITGMILGALAETLWPTWNTDHYFGDDDFGNYYFDDYYDYDDYDGNDDFYFGDYFGEYGDYDEYYEYDEHGYDYGGFGDIGGYYGLAG